LAINILCPSCNTRLNLTDDRAGSTFTCPRCDTKMMIPGSIAPPPVASAYAEPRQDFREDDSDEAPVSKRRSRRKSVEEDEDDDRRPRSRSRGFECPYCGSHRAPIVKTQISSTGWIVFALLLIFTVCLCFIGLFITEETRTCRDCGMKLS